jgi:hypothetical protein
MGGTPNGWRLMVGTLGGRQGRLTRDQSFSGDIDWRIKKLTTIHRFPW